MNSTSIPTKKSFSNLLIYYWLGGFVILLGIIIFMNSIWASFNAGLQFVIAAGSALVAYIISMSLAEKNYPAIAAPFFFIFAILCPVAVSLSYYQADLYFQSISDLYQFGFAFLACFWAFRCYPRTDILCFVILYASLYFFAFMQNWEIKFFSNNMLELNLITLLIVGIVYSVVLFNRWSLARPGLAKALSRIGMVLVLVSLLILRDRSMPANWFWEILMIIGLSLDFLLAKLRQDVFLKIIGFIFFILYVLAFSKDYFAHSLGWPLTLIVIGFIVIISTFVYLRKR